MNKLSYLILSLTVLISLTVCASRPDDGGDESEKNKDKNIELVANQNIVALPAPEKASFADEEMPLEYFDVNEFLSRELTSISYGHGLMVQTIRLANRYFPIIEPILKEQGVPDDFKYLCVAESNLQNVISPARAVGYWQILEGTAKEFGLEINNEVDERYHIEKSTVAACKYFKRAYAKYNNWTLAAASYNVGMAHIDGQIKRQKTENYYDMSLNVETSRYVYRAVAYKEIMTKPHLYGFNVAEKDLYKPLEYKEVEVKTGITCIADFAEKHSTNYKMIKIFNPWLRDGVLTNAAKKTYVVKIPKEGFREGK